MCPFLATMYFAGDFHVRFLLSDFPVVILSPTVFSVWFGLVPSIVYLVTTAGVVDKQLDLQSLYLARTETHHCPR